MRAKELVKEVEDLKDAMRTIGKILIDDTLKQSTRTDRIIGILHLWECEPPQKVSPS